MAKGVEALIVWERARKLVNGVYAVSRRGRLAGDWALRDQMRRSAISVLSNLAEGYERDGNREFVQFLYVVKGSAGELRAQLMIAHDQGYLLETEYRELRHLSLEVGRMAHGLIESLRRSQYRGRKYRNLAPQAGT